MSFLHIDMTQVVEILPQVNSLEECVERVKAWKEGLESKGLLVNMTKTKFMASGLGASVALIWGHYHKKTEDTIQ